MAITKDLLKELGVNEEGVNKLWEMLGKEYVSKADFNAKNEQLKALKQEQEERAKELENLKAENASNVELTQQIKELQEKAKAREEEYTAQLNSMKVEAIVERELLKVGARNTKAVKSLLDLENVEFEGDTIKGLAKQLEAISKSDGYLFNAQPKPTGTKPANQPSVTNGITKDDFNKMTYAQKVELYNTNKGLYDELSN